MCASLSRLYKNTQTPSNGSFSRSLTHVYVFTHFVHLAQLMVCVHVPLLFLLPHAHTYTRTHTLFLFLYNSFWLLLSTQQLSNLHMCLYVCGYNFAHAAGVATNIHHNHRGQVFMGEKILHKFYYDRTDSIHS